MFEWVRTMDGLGAHVGWNGQQTNRGVAVDRGARGASRASEPTTSAFRTTDDGMTVTAHGHREEPGRARAAGWTGVLGGCLRRCVGSPQCPPTILSRIAEFGVRETFAWLPRESQMNGASAACLVGVSLFPGALAHTKRN